MILYTWLENPVVPKVPKDPFALEYSLNFNRNTTLNQHGAANSNDMPFSCKERVYEGHLPAHSGENRSHARSVRGHAVTERTQVGHMPAHSGEKPSPGTKWVVPTIAEYACPDCDFRCSTNESMKIHMKIHKKEKYYVCEEIDCLFESKSKELLNSHRTSHKSWAQVAKSPAHKHLPKVQAPVHMYNAREGHNQGSKRQNPSYSKHQIKKETTGKRGFTTGSNIDSPLSVSPKPHMANIFATGFSARTTEEEVKRDLEFSLQRKTGKIYRVKVEKEQTQYNYYSNFRISCYCVNSEIFMDSSIWPQNCKVKWYSRKRNGQEGQKYHQN